VITTGAIDMVTHRKDQRNVISNLVSILLKKENVQQTIVENVSEEAKAVNQ